MHFLFVQKRHDYWRTRSRSSGRTRSTSGVRRSSASHRRYLVMSVSRNYEKSMSAGDSWRTASTSNNERS